MTSLSLSLDVASSLVSSRGPPGGLCFEIGSLCCRQEDGGSICKTVTYLLQAGSRTSVLN